MARPVPSAAIHIPPCAGLRAEDVWVAPGPRPGPGLLDQWGRAHRLGPTAIIGRDPDAAQLVVSHPSVSRRHAYLRCVADDVFEIIDHGSTNGTFLGTRRVTGVSLAAEGQVLVVGDVGFVLLSAANAELHPCAPGARSTSSAAPPTTTLMTVRWELRGGAGDARVFCARASAGLPADEWRCLVALIAARQTPVTGTPSPLEGYVRSVDLAASCGDAASVVSIRAVVRRLRASLASIGVDDGVEEHERFGYRLRIMPTRLPSPTAVG